jgi:hypothetical protein
MVIATLRHFVSGEVSNRSQSGSASELEARSRQGKPVDLADDLRPSDTVYGNAQDPAPGVVESLGSARAHATGRAEPELTTSETHGENTLDSLVLRIRATRGDVDRTMIPAINEAVGS